MNETETIDRSTINYVRKLHRWRMAFFGLAILLAGIVIGVTSTLMLAWPGQKVRPQGPEFISKGMIHRLQRDLHLSAEQTKKIGAILQKHMQKLDEIRMKARPQIVEDLQLMNEEVSTVLTEEQKQVWQRRFRPLQRQLRPRGPRPGEGLRHRRGQQERTGRGPQRFGPGASPNRPTVPPEQYE